MKVNKLVLYVLVLLEAGIWGFSFVGTKTALESVTATEVLAMRWTIGALALVVLSLVGVIKVDFKSKPILPVAAVTCLQSCVYAIFECLGIERTTASESAIIIATLPIGVLLVSALVFRKKIGIKTSMAITWAFAGVACMFAFSPDFSLGGKQVGYLFLIGAVLSGSVYTILSNRLGDRYAPMEITVVLAVEGSIFFTILTLIQGYGFRGYAMMLHNSSLLLSILFLGFGCTAFAYVCYNIVIACMPPHQSAAIQANIINVVAVASGILMKGDAFGWYTVVGLIMVISGLILTNKMEAKYSES